MPRISYSRKPNYSHLCLEGPEASVGATIERVPSLNFPSPPLLTSEGGASTTQCSGYSSRLSNLARSKIIPHAYIQFFFSTFSLLFLLGELVGVCEGSAEETAGNLITLAVNA